METKLYTAEDLQECGEQIRHGELICFPTETVYGLGANALDPAAVAKIFQVKKRPANNPMIAHICDTSMLPLVTGQIPETIRELTDLFWPGPFTVVLPRGPKVPEIVSAGLPTVAIRCPDHPLALGLIREAGVPIVAPSANRSGRPSPTCPAHCREDLSGLIAGIIDGGECAIGLESTVVAPMGGRKLKLLRPGAITVELMENVGFAVEADPAILAPVQEGQKVSSPGMLHRHYAPKAPLTVVTGSPEAVCRAIQQKQGPGVWVLAFEEYMDRLENALSFGSIHDPSSQSHALFGALRQFDTLNCKQIYAMAPSREGVGLAVCNRLYRAASFQIVPAERLLK